jgi:hypothetical protein
MPYVVQARLSIAIVRGTHGNPTSGTPAANSLSFSQATAMPYPGKPHTDGFSKSEPHIAKGKGPTHGDDPRSFRAEGYGMASALLYLRLLLRQIEFTQETRSKNTLICDKNEGLIIHIVEAVHWSYTTPNVLIRVEWDIKSVILEMYQKLNIKFKFKHVKSHQNDDPPTESWSLETRLNIEADRLAMEYMQEDLIWQPIAAIFPSAKAQLIHFFASDGIQIRQYLLERNEWSERTLDKINWESHGASHSYHWPQRCHHHLPLGQTLHHHSSHRRDSKYSSICPGCRLEPEMQHRYLQCEVPSRMAWRIKHY